jgi:FdhE protein
MTSSRSSADVSIEVQHKSLTKVDLSNLQQVSKSNPDLETLVRMLSLAVQAVADEHWARGTVTSVSPTPDVPRLHMATIDVDRARLHNLVRALAHEVPDSNESASPIRKWVQAADPIALIHAALTHDEASIERMAAQHRVDSRTLGLIAQLGALPLLVSCFQRLTPEQAMPEWQQGYCPICGAWPMLAEMRGLEREHWLRCGRCSSGWRYGAAMCTFCREDRHEQLGYLAPETERESRRATTCEQCHGYLKTVATLAPLSLPDMLALDLSSIVLDLAALEAGYTRPSTAGYKFDARLEAARPAPTWAGWFS